MGSKKIRRKFSPEEKATILRRHLVDKIPISDLCDEYHIQPSQFYQWQKQAMESMALAFEGNGKSQTDSRLKKLSEDNKRLQERLVKKDNVIAEISEEYVTLKKELGEL